MNCLFERCDNEGFSGEKIILAGLVNDANHAILLSIEVRDDLVELSYR